MKFEENELKELRHMIYWIAKRHKNWKGISYRDLENDLWCKAIKIIKKIGEINYNLIATSLYRYSIDIYRKIQAKSAIPFSNMDDQPLNQDSHEFEDYDYDSAFPEVHKHRALEIKFFEQEAKKLAENNTDYSPAIVVKDMLKLFIPKSKEYMFIRLAALYFDIDISENRYDGWRFEDFFTRDRFEYSIAVALGFSNDTSSGYRALRQRIKNTLDEHGFYDLLLLMDEN